MSSEAKEPQYYDIDGNPVSLYMLCRKEPEWAANRIRHMREQLAATGSVPAPSAIETLLLAAEDATLLLSRVLDGEVAATRATAVATSNRLHGAIERFKAAEVGKAPAPSKPRQ